MHMNPPSSVLQLRQRRTVLPALLALVVALVSAKAQTISNMWKISPADLRIMFTNVNEGQRGIAVNPVTGNVLVPSRVAATNAIFVLDGATGADIGILNAVHPEGLTNMFIFGAGTGVTFPLNTVGAADDGAVYVGNLVVSNATSVNFRILRWSSDDVSPANTPLVAWSGNPGDFNGGANSWRWGDAMAIRGAGTNTQILVTSDSRYIALFRTLDGTNFTPTVLSITNLTTTGQSQRGVAFAEGDTFWIKNQGVALRKIRFFPGANVAAVETALPTSVITGDINQISYSTNSQLLAGLLFSGTSPVGVRVYDMSLYPGNAILFSATNNLAVTNASGNRAGAVVFGGTNKIFYIGGNSGMAADYLAISGTPLPPSIVSFTGNQTAYEGASNVTFTLAVSAKPPIGYQWYLGGALIAGETNTSLVITQATAAFAGGYFAIATNLGGSVTSTVSTLTLLPALNSTLTAPLWTLPPGSRPYLSATDNSQRGFAFNPATSNLLVVSRAQSNAVIVIDALTGADKRGLPIDPLVVASGTFPINQVGATDDGAVFAANLVTAASVNAPLRLFLWESDSVSSGPFEVAILDPGSPSDTAAAEKQAGLRWGDSMVVRGALSNQTAQILLAPSTGTNVSLLLPDQSGVVFDVQSQVRVIRVAGATSGFAHLGIAFGPGTNTFWAKGAGGFLRLVEFDLAARTGMVTRVYSNAPLAAPLGSTSISFHPGLNLLGAVAFETPDNLRLYDVSDLALGPVLRDQKLFGVDNANINATGGSAFGAGKLFALSSNNGLIALSLNNAFNPGVPVFAATNQFAVTTNLVATNNSVIVRWPSVPARVYRVESKDDLSATNWSSVVTLSAPAATTTVTNVVDGVTNRFYRIRAL